MNKIQKNNKIVVNNILDDDYNSDGFIVYKNGVWGTVLEIESNRLEQCLKYLIKNNIRCISLSRNYFNFKESNLSFLNNLEGIDGIMVDGEVSPIQIKHFKDLKYLGIGDNGKDILDLSWFPELKSCALFFTKRLKNLNTCQNLVDLTLSNYDSSTKNFELFPELRNLEKLTMFQAKIYSFMGIGKLKKLKEFEFALCRTLASIEGITEISKTLEILEISNAKKIKDFTILLGLKKLKKLKLSDCASIKSLKFIKELPLEFLSFVGTPIVDGDLTPAIGIKYIGFDDKRNYSHKFKELNPNFKINI